MWVLQVLVFAALIIALWFALSLVAAFAWSLVAGVVKRHAAQRALGYDVGRLLSRYRSLPEAKCAARDLIALDALDEREAAR